MRFSLLRLRRLALLFNSSAVESLDSKAGVAFGDSGEAGALFKSGSTPFGGSKAGSSA